MAYKINTAVVGFGIGHFIAVADGSAITTGTPTCGRIIDGVHGACANAAVYTTSAWEIDLVAGDMNGTNIILTFSLAGAIPISYTIKTETKLVSELKDETMVGTDGANTTTPPTVTEIQAAMEEDGASILDSIRDLLPGTTIAAANDIPAMVGTNNALLAASVTIADGAIKSDLTHIHGTALTETAGQLAAAFKKFFDVATPLLVASTVMRGTDGVSLVIPDAAGTAAVPGAAMNLAPDAIKKVSYDESTAWPLLAADAAATQIARVGADGDTLETLSDEIAAVKTEVDKIGTIPALDGAGQTIGAAIAKLADDSGGAAFNAGTDSQRKIAATAGASSAVAVTTDVATSNTATSFTLTAGAPAALAYPDMQITVTDANGNQSTETRRISNYTNGRVVTVDTAFSFTPAVGDIVVIERAYLGVSVSGGDATEAKQDLMIIDLDLLTKISEADTVIDTSDDTQWVLIFNEKGTDTEIMRKNMIDINGAAITATSAVVGAHEHTAS